MGPCGSRGKYNDLINSGDGETNYFLDSNHSNAGKTAYAAAYLDSIPAVQQRSGINP